ncbi:MAG TPA: carboxypeptidase regulatory-like domain-containing protein [Burkholderiales bacterium]|jgi:virginiamycin B lyase|nr:carboxypeptidase regulatory-like domain-containing protein [Burkholderiales bacterium]
MKRFLVAILAVAFNLFPSVRDAAAQSAAGKAELSGLATVSGTVTSAVPFQAAKVYFRNADRRMQYMVYTAGGNYQALHLLPGKYEMRVEARGLDSEVTQVVLNPGSNPPQNVVLRPVQSTGAQIVSMSEMFPAGSGQRPLREVCVGCHSPDFFGARHYPEAAWASYIEMMLKGGQVAAGFLSEQDRLELAQYLGKNFGPESRRRTVRYDRQVPLDEAKLAKAMYVEYYLKPNDDPKLRRRGQDPHFDQQGNVWITDRNVPNRLSRLDPRTGEWKDWPMPHPDGETHGLTIDKDGIVWVPERMGKRKDNDGLHLAAFDPKTETWELFPIDPERKIKERLQSHTPVVDYQGNVWVTMIGGDRFYKWDRAKRTVQMFETPTRPSAPYGIDVDSQGNIWMALFRGDVRVGKYDVKSGKFSEYKALTQPGRMRRASVDMEDRVWYGVYDRGILGYIDPKSGTATEFKVPLDISRPYDPQADYEGNVWFGDDGQGGTTTRFNIRTREFTYFPTPQVADQPKIEITRDGAVWYCPRSGAEPGVGVLYPDVSKLKTLGAYYLDVDAPTSRMALRKQRPAREAAVR